MRDFNKISIVLFLIIMASCRNAEQPNSETEISFRYFNLEGQGWKSKTHRQKIDNISFTATVVPIQYYLLKEMGNENLSHTDSIYQLNKRERIVEFTFEEEHESDLLQEKFTKKTYDESVRYMSFTIEEDFYLVTTKGDSVKCSGMQFERNFKTAPYNKILLFFSDIDPNDKVQLVYHDVLFQKGIVKFNFQDQPINL